MQYRKTTEEIRSLIRQASGREKANFAIRNARIFHMTDGSIEEGDILICGDKIAGIGRCCREIPAEREFDAKGMYALPGFIDTHVHIESSLLSPREYEKCVLKYGVTTSVCDPHELSNVFGTAAWDYFIKEARTMAMDLVIRLSSCVPATDMETAGAEITAEDIAAYQGKDHVAGLGEMMNFPGVLFENEEVLKKLAAADHIDGHSPLLSGNSLNAYLAAGAENCHECTSKEEAEEKLKRGMNILIREGSAARNLDALLPVITLKNAPFLAFCTDDRNPSDIRKRRHIDGMIARCIQAGIDPFTVYRIATFSAARISGLYDRGILAPGKRADILLISDLEKCTVKHTFAAGKEAGEALFTSLPAIPDHSNFLQSIRREKVKAEDFRIPADWKGDVIEVVPHTIISKKFPYTLPEKNGELLRVPEMDIQKLAVLERYGKNGNIGKGFVRGFGMRSGAIASSVGHDCHNICVTGTNEEDMALAVNALIEKGGGFAVAQGGKLIKILPLPLGGLMSERPFEEVADEVEDLMEKVKITGCLPEEPFMVLAFLVLPVIPEIKLTDKGLVDVEKFCFY